MIAIVDYDVGNVASVANMLRRIGETDSVVTREPSVLNRADKVILPGVGGFEKGMRNLTNFGLVDVLDEIVRESQTPVLGICLGMQLMTRSSEEGDTAGLGWIDAETLRIRTPAGSDLKIPHMGWNYVRPTRVSPLFPSDTESRFYFVHAYHVRCHVESDVIATTSYGAPLTSAFRHDNIFGVQFHPEKSHSFGMQLLKNFAEL